MQFYWDAGSQLDSVLVSRTYMLDGLGNVIGSSLDGSTGAAIIYDSWGNVQTDSTGYMRLNTLRFGFKGMLYDETTGLYNARTRWYQPDVGRFMSEDPIGLGGGINQYTFAADDPTNNSDPSGMDDCITVNVLPAETCAGNQCTIFEGYTREVCISGGGSGGGVSSGGIGGGGGGNGGLGQPPTPTRPPTQPKPTSKAKPIRACFTNSRFSSLFPEGTGRTAAQFFEIAPPLSFTARIALQGSADAAEHRAETILTERVVPRLTTGFLTPVGAAVVKYENVPMDIAAAFTVGYNGSILAQCALGLIE